MSNAALAFLMLLFCSGQSGCGQEQTAKTTAEQPTHDATGYLIQPSQDFLVRGERPAWKNLFIQFDVNGDETRPFILNIEDTVQLNDAWPPASDPKKINDPVRALRPPPEDPPRPFGWVSLNSEEVSMLAETARKYSAWSDTSAKENLNVEEKQMLRLTNQQFSITFSRPKELSNSFMNLYVPDKLLAQSPLPPLPFSITLDKMGVERLLSVITNLPSRRDKFIAFRDEQEKIVRQRNEAQQNDKARADELLH